MPGHLYGNGSSGTGSSSGGGHLYGNSPSTPTDSSIKSKIFNNPVSKAGLGVLATVGDILGRPNQAVLGAANAGQEGDIGVGQLKGAWKGFSGHQHVEADKAILGKHVGGVGGGVTRFALSTATDPLTYLTAGTGKAAEIGIKEAGELAARQVLKEGGDEIAVQAAKEAAMSTIRKQGLKKALSETAQSSLKQSLVEKGVAAGVRNPEKYASKILKATATRGKGGIIARIPGTSVGGSLISGSNLGKAAEVTKLTETANLLKNTPTAKLAARTFIPGARDVQAVGKESGTAAHIASRARESDVDQAVQKAAIQLSAAQKLVPGYDHAADSLVQYAQESSNGLKLLRETRPELEPVLHAANNLRESSQLLSKADNTLFKGGPRLFTKTVSDAGNKVLNRNREAVITALRDVGTGKNADFSSAQSISKTLLPDLPTAEANKLISKTLEEKGLLKSGQSFFNEGGLSSTLEEAKTTAQQVAQVKYANKLSELDNINAQIAGKPAKLVIPEGAKAPASYVKTKLGEKTIQVPKELESEFKGMQRLIEHDPDLAGFSKILKSWNTYWRAGATVLPVGGSFTARNARSNVFLNYLAGVTHPAVYRDALKIQKAISKVSKSPEFRDLVANGKMDEALSKVLSPREVKLYKLAIDHDVLGTGFIAEDVKTGKSFQSLKGTNNKAKAVGRQFTKEGAVLRLGAAGNQAVENNARLAHFISKYDEYGNAAEAAASVKKYLFDYGELTAAERKIKDNAIPFYTFMRKNTPLMLEQLAKNPGKFTLRQHFVEAFTTPANENPNVPNYLKGERILPQGVANLLGANGRPTVTTNDQTLAAAANSLQPIASGLGAIPGVRAVVPQSARANTREQAFRDLLGVVNGPIPGAFKYGAEEASGRSLFTGNKLYGSPQERALQAATPAAGRARGLTKGARNAAILRLLTGLKTTEVKR